jgi:hypothetical protein
MIRKLYFLSFALAMLLGWSCEQNELILKEDPAVSADVDPQLVGTWLLVNGPLDIGLGTNDPGQSRGSAWMALLKTGKMRGHSSRNVLAGNFTSKDNKVIGLEVNMLTRVADDAFSTWYMNGIRSAGEYRLEGSTLTFLQDNSREELIFAKLEDQCSPILKDKALYNNISKEPDAVIKQAYQIENCLVIEVTYGGGCTEQVPSLVWDGSLGKSLPPLAPLKLNFPKDDPCEALITKTYYFDLLAFFTATGYDEIRLALPGLKQELIVEKQ